MTKVSIFVLGLTLFFTAVSCKKKESFPGVEVVGHAGAGLDVERVPFPGNTQQSLDFAAMSGMKHVEIDLQLSADNHWILFHNDFLSSQTNLEGCVRQYTREELMSARYIAYPNIRIQALLETDFRAYDKVFLDIRHFNPCDNFSLVNPEFMHEEIEQLAESHPNQRFVIVSRNVAVLQHFKNKNFDICHEVTTFEAMQNSLNNWQFDFFIIRNSNINSTEVEQIRNQGARVMIYGVKSHAGNADAMRKKPNFVMTDAIISALKLTQ